MGLGSERGKPPPRWRAQIWLLDWKTRYFPSAVQRAQHAEFRPPGSKRCKFVPSAETSQSEKGPISLFSWESNCRRLPSGDQTRCWIKFFVVTSLRDSVPSDFARNKSPALEYASISPSGDQAADLPTASPSLRGDPPR